MRAAAILGEVWRNVRSGTTRALLLALLLAVTTTVLTTADLVAVVSLEEKAGQFRESGAAIRTLTAESSIDADSCDTIASADTVGASGGIAASTPISVTTLPGGSIPAFAVSPPFAAVLGLDPALPAGVWIPSSLAETLHATIGTTLPTTAGELSISGIYDWPDDGRDSRLNYAVLVPDATRPTFDECWAEVWPTSAETDDLLRFAGAGGANDTPVALSQANKNLGTSFDGHTEYRARITQFTLPVGAVIGVLIAVGSVRLRRLEYAGALHAGQRKLSTLATGLLETTVWAGVASLLAVAALSLTARALSPESAATLVATGLRTVAATATGALVGTALALALVRENHLFRYFKDR